MCTRPWRFLLFPLLLAASACASGAKQTGPSAAPGSLGEVTVAVHNHNWADMNVFAIVRGVRHRLGTVSTTGRQLFRLPASLVSAAGEFFLVADPIGAPSAYRTENIMVNPGQRVEFTIQNHLATSSVSVR